MKGLNKMNVKNSNNIKEESKYKISLKKVIKFFIS